MAKSETTPGYDIATKCFYDTLQNQHSNMILYHLDTTPHVGHGDEDSSCPILCTKTAI
ncbi:hypothetical protein EGR_00841 [Echinococcus granulosus]|uniref:Uncharacterized protein n=1 Tax=Echinococcus granulosus TaxID=6210 RepID=W6V0B2_ECHGR|nr:hypothetical protein EGR_00841 [Echinococcus granulosus]EUB64297.1 hypothetical protein EGR_00841 [Echinococcus granulosus]